MNTHEVDLAELLFRAAVAYEYEDADIWIADGYICDDEESLTHIIEEMYCEGGYVRIGKDHYELREDAASRRAFERWEENWKRKQKEEAGDDAIWAEASDGSMHPVHWEVLV